MTEEVNITPLEVPHDQIEESDSHASMVTVDHVSMVFNMASERLNSLKEYAIAIARREFMFKEFKALDDVSFEVKKGDVFGILGTNGSGKSTLLKIVAGVLDPTEGTCTINGNIAPLIELGAGFDMELTARENIYLNGALLGYSRAFINQHFDEIVKFAEIESFLDMPMKNYSSGMVARIAFAIATVIVPEILIVDEVLSVGDFMFQQKCERRIMQLIKEHGVTVLLVSHDNDQIERLCNKAIWIEKGHARIRGSAKEVCRIYRVLGGHQGSRESEACVFKALHDHADIPTDALATIAGEDRYGTAVKLLGHSEAQSVADTVILAPGEVDSPCMLANALASMLNVPLLLTKRDSLPDVTAQELKRLSPRTVVILGAQDYISDDVVSMIEQIGKTSVEIARIDEDDVAGLARGAFERGSLLGSWGSTAVITYDGCTGDTISLLPFICTAKAPLFYITTHCVIDQETSEAILSGSFNRLIVLGGQASFPDACLQPFVDAHMEVVRFCGKTPYHANELINNWTATWAKENDLALSDNLIVASLGNTADAFAVGPFAKTTRSTILLETPQDLDSVAYAINVIESKRGLVKHLTFLGDSMSFSKTDKEILGKALARATEECLQ